mmetsp:Transcript_24967/g.57361  ORF Transcript_24967/g.57361 Transcript_24967/m.57361 type:complete len:225 (-) Transcript_24967:96-770(-)
MVSIAWSVTPLAITKNDSTSPDTSGATAPLEWIVSRRSVPIARRTTATFDRARRIGTKQIVRRGNGANETGHSGIWLDSTKNEGKWQISLLCSPCLLQALVHAFTVGHSTQRLLAAQELQHVLTVLLNSSARNSASPQYDNDYQFTDQDIEQLLLRLKTTLNVADRDRLRVAFHNASTRSFRRIYQAASEDVMARYQVDATATATAAGLCHDDSAAFDFLQWND